jgi:hypothetical protein
MTTSPTRKKAAFYLAVVFIAGGLLGLSASEFYGNHFNGRSRYSSPVEYRKQLLEKLSSDLDLDAEQQESIDTILVAIGGRVKEVQDAIKPEFAAIRRERTDRIMGVLDVQQQDKYRKIIEESEKRREKREQERARGN